MTNPSDAQRPRWRTTVEETGFPDERAVVVWVDDETSFRITPWSIMRWTDERIDQFAEQVVALEADLGRAREDNDEWRRRAMGAVLKGAEDAEDREYMARIYSPTRDKNDELERMVGELSDKLRHALEAARIAEGKATLADEILDGEDSTIHDIDDDGWREECVLCFGNQSGDNRGRRPFPHAANCAKVRYDALTPAADAAEGGKGSE